MSPNEPGRTPRRLSSHAFLGFIALAGLALIGMSALGLADTALLVSVPTTMFLCVYLSCMVSAVRILSAGTRAAAAVAVLAVLAVLAFCGWARDRDAARAHRRTQSHESERTGSYAPALLPCLPRLHRPGRPGADRNVRAPAGRHRAPGERADHDVPVRLPQLHGVRGAHSLSRDQGRRRRRGAGGARGPGLLRLGAAGRRRRRRGRRPGRARE